MMHFPYDNRECSHELDLGVLIEASWELAQFTSHLQNECNGWIKTRPFYFSCGHALAHWLHLDYAHTRELGEKSTHKVTSVEVLAGLKT